MKAAGRDKYKYEFMKAFWTYRTTDQEFECEVMETQKICNMLKIALQELAVIPIFNKDPYAMTAEEFALYYEEAKSAYLGHSIAKDIHKEKCEAVENNNHKFGRVLKDTVKHDNPLPQAIKGNKLVSALNRHKLLEKRRLNEGIKEKDRAIMDNQS